MAVLMREYGDQVLHHTTTDTSCTHEITKWIVRKQLQVHLYEDPIMDTTKTVTDFTALSREPQKRIFADL